MKKIDNQVFFNNLKLEGSINPPIIICDQLNSSENLGAILRLADNFGVKKVFVNAFSDQYKLSKIKRNATTAFNKVELQFIENLDELKSKIPAYYSWVALDTTSNSVALQRANFPSSVALVIGNESMGLSQELLNLCDCSVHIEMLGETYSMNVTQATAIALYEITKKES